MHEVDVWRSTGKLLSEVLLPIHWVLVLLDRILPERVFLLLGRKKKRKKMMVDSQSVMVHVSDVKVPKQAFFSCCHL